MSSLEARYRRLLALFPRDHRDAYEDEMVGVLLATARPGQRWPGVRDALDLLRAGLLVRAGRPWRSATASAWLDGLAIVSLLGPILLSAYVPVVGPQDGYYQVSASGDGLVPVYPWFIWFGWPLVLVAIPFGLRRLALVAAWVCGLVLPFHYWSWDTAIALWFPLALVSAAALTWSPGPARGMALLGWRRVICYLVGVGLLDAGVIAVTHLDVAPSESWPTTVLIWSGMLLAIGAAMDFSSRAGRRAAVLFAAPIVWIFVWDALATASGFAIGANLFFAGPALALAVVWAAVWLLERHRTDDPVTIADPVADRRADPGDTP
ncbi:MAG: hypothetical protein L0Y54_14775 [Sporichthyaceae bacterium]|nr:hypothetical protein [Sporichthyaceae bacterium]